jgi:chemotaxis protein CheX
VEIILPATLDRSAVEAMAGKLRAAIESGEEIVVDAGNLDRIGQAGLQLLLSARKSADVAGIAFGIVKPSIAISDAAALTGLAGYLFPAPASI